MSTPGPVSVVVPTYDRVDLLRRALDSALSQTVPPGEVVVVDDASPDPVEPVLAAAYDAERLRVVRHDANRGAAAARNTGAEAATGEYVAFLDSDDYWAETKLERQLAVVAADPEVDLVYCDQHVVEPDGAVRDSGKRLPESDLWGELLDGWTAPNTSTLLFDRGAFLDLGGFDESLESCQDHDLWMRVARADLRVRAVDEPLSYFARDADDRISHDRRRRMNGVERFLEKWRDPIADARSERAFERFAEAYYARAALPLAYAALLQRNVRGLLGLVRQYLLFNPFAYRYAAESLPTLCRRVLP